MLTEQQNSTALFRSYAQSSAAFLDAFNLFNQQQLNIIPFEASWTAAQVADHIVRVNSSLAKVLEAETKLAEREADKRAEDIKNVFLNFGKKFTSPDFVRPREGIFDKQKLHESLEKSISSVKEAGNKTNLAQIVQHPALGEITKLEMLVFAVYHTQRHTHQLKNIFTNISHKGSV